MHRAWNVLPTAVAVLLCLGGLTSAAPVPKKAKDPITAKNAHQLNVVKELSKPAWRVIRGPSRNELTLLDFNKSVEVVDDKTGRTLRVLNKDFRPTDFAQSPDGKYRAWKERDSKAYVLEEIGGERLTIETGNTPGQAAFSRDGKILAIGDTFWEPRREGVGVSKMQLYDLKGKLIRTLAESGPGSMRPVFSPDNKILAVGNRNYETRLFDVATGKLLHVFNKRMTQEIAFSPDGKTLATGYVDGTLALWDVATGKLLHSKPSGCKEVYSVDWTPKGDVLASSGVDGKIVLWEPTTMTKLKELDAPRYGMQVRFTTDGSRLVTSGIDVKDGKREQTVTVWSVGRRGDR